ncbi:hypothetical protein PGN35_001840 [Nodosilinea sp. PGN35]|uniref:hypothetical protein n=1 Tax=Nodosilinea sp. PGN35 TaxID=3020489 RepID=UPI0023B263B7|nr:hypothetical protein [Nodosilinea sp. TSF1-S3]MDF0368852.1 hypothetical protein [Nodosilinea sp. TSF1-S3]
MTFTPTHVLISRTKETPVQLAAGPKGYWLYTEAEWQKDTTPAFEMRPKLGLYCRGQQVVGFRLQPISEVATATLPPAAQVAQ